MKRRTLSRAGVRRGLKGLAMGTAATGLALWSIGGSVQATAAPPTASNHNPQWFVQALVYKGNNTSQTWTLSTFQRFAKEGITGVEVNLDWAAIEPKPGVFNFTVLQKYLQYCQETHLKLIPIFWEYIPWYTDTPGWLPGGTELTNTGAPASEPAFWSARANQAYFTFVGKTVAALTKSPAFGGAYIDYGWNDAGYGPTTSGFAGYAPQDVAMFHHWLAQNYSSITALNSALGTKYQSFAAVPAFAPGQANFSVYQRFRFWSYQTLLGQTLAVARKATTKPLLIYWGGGISDVGMLANPPDVLFKLAKQYHAIVNLDNADHTSFASLFGYLSQSYQVPLLEEWSPTEGTHTQLAHWMGHYPLEGAYRYGFDYFMYGGTGQQPPFFANTYPSYLAWHSALAQVRGAQPQFSTGIMLGYDQLLHNNTGAGLNGDTFKLADYLRSVRPAANIFTDLSVLNGAVSLSRFHTIVDWNSDLDSPNLNPHLLAALKAFKAHGGTILPGPSYANAYPAAPQSPLYSGVTGGITVVPQPDGRYTVQTVLGQPALVSQLGVSGTSPWVQNLYFQAPPSLVPSTQPNVQIKVTYANNQTNGFYLQYDSSDKTAPVNGAYATAYPVGTQAPVKVTNTGKYLTATFDLTNAVFQGAENGGADFRILVEKPGLAVSSVTVTAGSASGTYTPKQAPTVSALPPAVVVKPNSPQVEAYYSAGYGKVWLVASDIGTSPFSGTISIPPSVLAQVLPGYKSGGSGASGSVAVKSLLGKWQAAGATTWKVDIASGGLAVLQIQRGN